MALRYFPFQYRTEKFKKIEDILKDWNIKGQDPSGYREILDKLEEMESKILKFRYDSLTSQIESYEEYLEKTMKPLETITLQMNEKAKKISNNCSLIMDLKSLICKESNTINRKIKTLSRKRKKSKLKRRR